MDNLTEKKEIAKEKGIKDNKLIYRKKGYILYVILVYSLFFNA